MVVPKKILHYAVELRAVRPKVDFSRPPVVYTNDLRSAEFQFEITDMSVTDLSTATATTLLYMRDGSFFQNPKEDVSLVGTTFSYTLKENEGNHAGIAKIQLIVTIGEAEYATQLYEFEIINGLETKVAQEVMIYDWTTLTRDARAYIDQFVADEVFRDAQFDNAQFDRNVAFVSSQESRDLAFGVEQTDRGAAFTTEQTDRNTAFNNAQDTRALTFSESESGRTTAENGRVTAEDDRVSAENNRVTKESQRVTAESSRVTAEGNRVTAESGRVTAESGRVTAETNRAAAFTAFDTRLTAEETATAANKISAVKSKTFADVDARIEDVEFDTTMMGTNLIGNGDFSNGTSGWSSQGSTLSASDNTLQCVGDGTLISYPTISQNKTLIQNNRYYLKAMVRVTNSVCNFIRMGLKTYSSEAITVVNSPVQNTWYAISSVIAASDTSTGFKLYHAYTSTAGTLGMVMEVRYFVAIDLTATFGAGNEPTAEQMDGIMSKFTNSWFDGTKNLFRANATLNKLMAIDARTEFEARNVVVNGDFSGGTTGWGVVGTGSLSASANILTGTIVTDGVGIIARNTSGSLRWTLNNKYYSRAMARTIDAGMSTLQMREGNNTDGLRVIGAAVASPVINQWYTFSDISSPTALNSDKPISVWLSATGVPTNRIEVKYVIVIDLTAAFGAGKEPTLAEMDRLMARFPNSWFDGMKPIQTIETLYQEKANKVQEAWITPTLLNGWVNYDAGRPPRYMKDNFGVVRFSGLAKSGTINTPIFTLPAGYYKPNSQFFIVKAGEATQTFGTLVVNYLGEVRLQDGLTTLVTLDHVSFRID